MQNARLKPEKAEKLQKITTETKNRNSKEKTETNVVDIHPAYQ